MAAKPMPSANMQVFAGVRNDVAPEHMRLGETTDMAAAANVDVNDAGRLRQRDGYTEVVQAVGMHSLYPLSDGACLVMQDTQIKRISADAQSIDTLSSGYTSGLTMRYADHNGLVYAMNGAEAVVYESGRIRRWGITRPTVPVVVATGGLMIPGKYAVALTYLDGNGRESGLSDPAEVTLTQQGGIEVSLVANPSDRITRIRVYVTAADGSVFMVAGEIPNVARQFRIATPSASHPATTQYYDRPQAGHALAIFRGRAYVAIENRIQYSAPFGLELFTPSDGFAMAERITMIAPAINGIYVSDTTGTYWLGGTNPKEFAPTKVGPPAFEGTLAFGTASNITNLEGDAQIPVWLSKSGAVVGAPGGSVVLPNDRFIPDQPSNAAALIKQAADSFQFIVTTGA
ncbi:MAG: hypothetical protein AB8B85_02670 [Paracoccaceae bacterium]